MVKYREILRLRAMGVSQRNVAISYGCSPTTVLTTEHKARELGLVWPLIIAPDSAHRSITCQSNVPR